jgi:hypothetical protein
MEFTTIPIVTVLFVSNKTWKCVSVVKLVCFLVVVEDECH